MCLLIHVNPAFLESFFPPVLLMEMFICREGGWESVWRPGKAGNNVRIDLGMGGRFCSSFPGAPWSSAPRGKAMLSSRECQGDASRAGPGLFGEQDGQKLSWSRFTTSERLRVCLQSLMTAAQSRGKMRNDESWEERTVRDGSTAWNPHGKNSPESS